jgi:hypothetical protein
VLIAQLSTASGVRSPLSHVADQVFLELAKEIEGQGVKRQVVADMFGMALRSYTKKMNRLTESASFRDRTLWEAIFAFVDEETPTRSRVVERFSADGEREVAAVLKDLVRSGLIYVTGTGKDSVYGVTSAEVRASLQRRQDVDAIASILWLKVFRAEATSKAELLAAVNDDAELLGLALDVLLESGRVIAKQGHFEATNFMVPLGAEQGWESAILDHFRAATSAIAAKVRAGRATAQRDDRVGGSTFTFTVHPEHPRRQEVYGLLPQVRSSVQELWDEVASYNRQNPPDPGTAERVSFYLGQNIEAQEDSE